MAARLSSVREVLRGADLRGGDPLLADATHDSRTVTAGALFCAVPGDRSDGHDHAERAVAAGAAALLVERWLDVDAPQVRVPSVRTALGPAAAVVHDRPADDLLMLGVTGTNGKTTVVALLESVLARSGRGTGVVGTLGVRLHGATSPLGRTTPEATDLQRLLRDLRTRGADAVAMEVSSHGLALHRVDGIRFAVVGFTNLTRDHLDFHGDMARYLAAKARLFTPELADHGVVLLDAPGARDLVAAARVPLTTVGTAPDADVTVRARVVGPTGGRAVLETADGPLELRTSLLGAYNLDNALLAATMALVAGLPHDVVAEGVAAAVAPPGRLEPIAGPAGAPRVVVDYAHTPDAVTNAVAVGRAVTAGRLAVVLGAGGGRDAGKRPGMGAAAASADLVVVTDDNPRDEDPAAIRAAVLDGLREARGADTAGPEVREIADRGDAIAAAVAWAGPEDVVLVLGKGHEVGQERAGRVRPFDDREVARDALHAGRREGAS